MRRSRSKYGNVRTELDGHSFDSLKEAQRYAELKLLERAGEISDLRMQVPYTLQPEYFDRDGKKIAPIRYYADFVYSTRDGQIIEDVKSPATRRDKVYQLKKKMMGYHGWYITEV